jgi:hypothetical protein
MMINIILSLLAGAILTAAGFYFAQNREPKPPQFNITVSLTHGRQKLTLNAEQYEQFTAWLGNADGTYDIEDEKHRVVIDRRYVAAVEVQKR